MNPLENCPLISKQEWPGPFPGCVAHCVKLNQSGGDVTRRTETIQILYKQKP